MNKKKINFSIKKKRKKKIIKNKYDIANIDAFKRTRRFEWQTWQIDNGYKGRTFKLVKETAKLRTPGLERVR